MGGLITDSNAVEEAKKKSGGGGGGKKSNQPIALDIAAMIDAIQVILSHISNSFLICRSSYTKLTLQKICIFFIQ